jgi:hypothetical protein
MQCLLSWFLQQFHQRFLGPVSITALLLPAATCSATTITFIESGISAAGTPLLVSAKLETAADAGGLNNALRITLRSFGAPTKAKADVLSSFYFNIADPSDGVRPTLTYVSGSGQAFEVLTSGSDKAVSWSPNLLTSSGTWTTSGAGANKLSNLKAEKDFNEGWQFRTLSPPPAYPGLGFGIGTVGNSDIGLFVPGASGSSAGFDPKVVRGIGGGETMINLGIYSTGTGTDIVPNIGLDGARLVRTEAVFNFTSSKDLDSLTQTWVQGNVTFGFGTGPDSVFLPEPGSVVLAGIGCLLAVGWRYSRTRGAGRHGLPEQRRVT